VLCVSRFRIFFRRYLMYYRVILISVLEGTVQSSMVPTVGTCGRLEVPVPAT
jgi:hypothetical protein